MDIRTFVQLTSFFWLRFSCFVMLKLSTDLLVWLNPYRDTSPNEVSEYFHPNCVNFLQTKTETSPDQPFCFFHGLCSSVWQFHQQRAHIDGRVYRHDVQPWQRRDGDRRAHRQTLFCRGSRDQVLIYFISLSVCVNVFNEYLNWRKKLELNWIIIGSVR